MQSGWMGNVNRATAAVQTVVPQTQLVRRSGGLITQFFSCCREERSQRAQLEGSWYTFGAVGHLCALLYQCLYCGGQERIRGLTGRATACSSGDALR